MDSMDLGRRPDLKARPPAALPPASVLPNGHPLLDIRASLLYLEMIGIEYLEIPDERELETERCWQHFRMLTPMMQKRFLDQCAPYRNWFRMMARRTYTLSKMQQNQKGAKPVKKVATKKQRAHKKSSDSGAESTTASKGSSAKESNEDEDEFEYVLVDDDDEGC